MGEIRNDSIRLCVPCEASYARSVRMMAANLAVLCSMNVDEVEDARMAAEEAFVYACATNPDMVDITFNIETNALRMTFALGEVVPGASEELAEQVGLAELLLSAVSDGYEIARDEAVLRVTKLVGGAHVA